MNRNMILAEWLRSYSSLQAAENLTGDGLYADAISRAYYAILHAAKAGLHVHDVATESHSAVRRMFGLHLVRPGKIEPEWSAYLTASLDDRFAADYDVETYFSKKVLLGFLWIHVQFSAEEQNRCPEIFKFPEPSCC